MAKGTVGTQSTGGTLTPKKNSYSLQSAQNDFQLGGVGGALFSLGKGAGSFVDTLGRAGVLGGQSRGNLFTYTPGAFAGTQPRPQAPEATQAPQPTTRAQMMSDRRAAPARPTGQAGAKYYLTPETPAARATSPQIPANAITPDFRISTTSPYANLVNPYGTDYRTGMMSRVSAQTARQFAPQREQLESRLSGSGITADSPLYQSLMAQQEGSESGARLQAVSAAEEAGIQAAANWDMQRAQGESGWQQNLQLTAERLARQPAELGSLEARRDADVVAAAVAQLDLETKTKLIEKARAALEADFMRKGYDAETARLESIAAAQSLERNDPNQWYNAWWWPIAGKAIGAALGGTAGFFIGGPAGALYGAGIGAGLMPGNIPFPQSGGAMSRPPAPGGSFQITPGGTVA